jgi:carbon storage regulator
MEAGPMLVLSRKVEAAILIDGRIRVRVLGIRGNQVRLGIEAPPEVKIVREELVAADAAAGVRLEGPLARMLGRPDARGQG